MITLKFKKLHEEALLPKAWTPGSVGLDVHAHILSETGKPNTILVPPRNTRNVPTGLLIEPPAGHFVMVCSRSGLAAKSIIVMNAPGIIDPDYRGELRVLIYNGGLESHYVQHGDRIAQLFLMPVVSATVIEVKELSSTERGDKGFGSTGSGIKTIEDGPHKTVQHADGLVDTRPPTGPSGAIKGITR